MKKISPTQLLRNFSEYINRTHYKGESFMIVRGSKVLAELVPPRGTSTCLHLADYLKNNNLSDSEHKKFAKDIDSLYEPKLEETEWES